MNQEETGNLPDRKSRFDSVPSVPIVLLAHAPPLTVKIVGATRVAYGIKIEQAVDEVFSERYGAKYATSMDASMGIADRVTQEMVRPEDIPRKIEDVVEEAYHKVGSSVSRIEREIRKQNMKTSRRKISAILDGLNLPRERRKKT